MRFRPGKRDGYFQRGARACFELITPRKTSEAAGQRGQSAAPLQPAASTMAELAATTELTALTDEASLTALGSGKVAVLFGADWDPPSQQLTQLLTEAANKKTYGTVKLATADADQCEALADAFDVEALPTLRLREHNATVATHEAPSAALVNETLQEFAKRESVPTDAVRRRSRRKDAIRTTTQAVDKRRAGHALHEGESRYARDGFFPGKSWSCYAKQVYLFHISTF